MTHKGLNSRGSQTVAVHSHDARDIVMRMISGSCCVRPSFKSLFKKSPAALKWHCELSEAQRMPCLLVSLTSLCTTCSAAVKPHCRCCLERELLPPIVATACTQPHLEGRTDSHWQEPTRPLQAFFTATLAAELHES